MISLENVIENIKRIKGSNDIENDIICAFEDYEFEGVSEIIVTSNQAYANHKDAPIIRFETEEEWKLTSVIDAWEV